MTYASVYHTVIFSSSVGIRSAHPNLHALTHWIPGVNRLGAHGRWAFVEFTDVWQIEDDFAEKVQQKFDVIIAPFIKGDKA